LRCFFYIALSIVAGSCFAQDNSDDKGRLGIKTSINGSLLTGTELENARPKFGYTAGAFYQYPISNNLGLHSEIVASFRGSNFKNGIGEYSKIALFYLDFPFLLTYQNSKDSKNQYVLGPYASYQALSSMFVGAKKKAEINDIAIKDLDYGVAFYYHKKSNIAILQIGSKIGLRNVNDGIFFENILPPTGNNGTIFNLSFEIGYLF